MHEISRVLQRVVDGLDDIALAQHHLVIEGHEPVLHVGLHPRDDVRPVLEQVVEELGMYSLLTDGVSDSEPFLSSIKQVRKPFIRHSQTLEA